MSKKRKLGTSARTLLLLALVCAFFAVLSTFDTSEQYRAWKTARIWTDEQKAVAPAQDADSMYVHMLVSLLLDTGVIIAAFSCLLFLAVAIATESSRANSVAAFFDYCALVLGILYSVSMIIYQIRVGPRVVLKGPIFDYNLHMQIPVIVAVAGYPLAALGFLIKRKTVTETD
ncbi:MAG: hypothetical protein LLF89_08860 [Spirochaetaceae bacterium]|nr:hypothetical protein [Spirochaetaceae bacterium]